MSQRLLVSIVRKEIQILLTLLTSVHGVNVMMNLLRLQIEISFTGFKLDISLKDKMKLFGIKFWFLTINIEKMLSSKLYKLHYLRPRMLTRFQLQ